MSLKFNTLGSSGLKISPLVVGCMTFGNKNWAPWVLDNEEEIFTIMKKCYDSGLRTFDTADVYSNGTSEILLGKFIKKYNIPREEIVIFTKLYFPVDRDPAGARVFGGDNDYYKYVNAQGLSRKHIFDAIEASVKRLGTYVDLLQIHRLDKSTPKPEIMRALNDVVSQGLTRYIGASSMKAVEFAELQFIAEKYNYTKFISMQNFYNLIYREEEREMIPFCQETEFGKVGLLPWSPIARGLLTRPVDAKSEYNRSTDTDKTLASIGLDKLSEADKTIISRVEEISKKHGVSMAVVATSWVVSKGTSPIVGLNSVKRVDDILKALEFKLTDEETAYLEEPYVPKAPIV